MKKTSNYFALEENCPKQSASNVLSEEGHKEEEFHEQVNGRIYQHNA